MSFPLKIPSDMLYRLVESLVTAIIFHQLFEGLSLGIRISSLSTSGNDRSVSPCLKHALAVLFAITTPAGILIGLCAFGNGGGNPCASFFLRFLLRPIVVVELTLSYSHVAELKLAQGLMSAISAG